MKLEVDKTHKTAKLNNLREIRKKITVTFLGVVLTVTFFSGCRNNNVSFETDLTDESYSNSMVIETGTTEDNKTIEERLSSYLLRFYGSTYVMYEFPEDIELQQYINNNFIKLNEDLFAFKGKISPYLMQVGDTTTFILNNTVPENISLEEIKGDNLIQIDEKTFKLKGVYPNEKLEHEEFEGAFHKVVDADTVFEVPGKLAYAIAMFKDVRYTRDMELTIRDFNYLEYYYVADYSDDLSWVKYCNNLEMLNINRFDDSNGNVANFDVLLQVPSLQRLRLSYDNVNDEVNFEKFGFLKYMKLDELEIYSDNIEGLLLESCLGVKNLSIFSSNKLDVNFQLLNHLDSLKLVGLDMVEQSLSIEDYLQLKDVCDIKFYESSGAYDYDRECIVEFLEDGNVYIYDEVKHIITGEFDYIYLNNKVKTSSRGK